MNRQHEWLLRECLKTDRVGHTGRSLYDHLHGTRALLKAWGADADVCTAGLFHSVYGTNAFKHVSMNAGDPRHRGALRSIIGERAERLAYLFCTCNRPKALLDAYDRWREHETVDLALRDLGDLIEIECANLLEQGLGRTIHSYRLGYRLAACMMISDKARVALLTRLGEIDRDLEEKNSRALEQVRRNRTKASEASS